MNEDLANLIGLQKLDDQIQALNKKKALQEAKIAQVEELAAFSMKEKEEVKAEIEELQKNKRAGELELKTKEENIARYKQQLTSVKNNKEYTALLHEIEILEKELSAIEEKILGFITEGEKLEKLAKEKQAVWKAAKEKVKTEQDDLKKECEIVEKDYQELLKGRGKMELKITPKSLSLYHKLNKSLKGSVVVSGSNSTCNGCYMSITPHQFQLLKTGKQVLVCQYCQRILYWTPTPVTT
ncbi:MAG: zinc ribbon domain-containing protein [bacterium]